jgi:adenylylsulfate kinase
MTDFPAFNNVSQMRLLKEHMLQQHARVFWMCGLSGAGKSTLAMILDKALAEKGFISQVIDGDVVRNGLNKGLGFSQDERRENLRRVAEVTKLFSTCGVITIVSFISPTEEIRHMIHDIIGDDYVEIFVNAPLSICEQRDTKGLYKQARAGKLKEFTGIDSPFEPPVKPDLNLDTHTLSVEQSAEKLLQFVLPLISQ